MSNAQKNQLIIETFYTAFAKGDSKTMVACYHDDVVFKDPAFGELQSSDAKKMWKMLVERGGDNLKITFKDVWADENYGGATWEAHYPYGKQKRPVHNIIKASFEFKDGKIVKHTDDFDLYRWSKQALGLSGWLLGWSGFMRRKIQEKTKGLLG